MLSIHQSSTSSRSGFTLIEVLFVAPIVLLTIAIFIGVLISLTGEVLVTRSNNSLAYNTQDALDMIEQDVRLSGAFLAVNSIAVTSPQGYNNDTTGFANASSSQPTTTLIINGIATTGGSNQLTRNPVWLSNDPNNCSAGNVDQNKAMTFNIIYFIREGTLWRRTLMPTTYLTAGCTTPNQQPSCNPDQSGTPCIARDIRVLDDISSLTIQYFTSATETTPVADASNPSLASTVRQTALNTTDTVKISLSAAQTVAGRDSTYSGVMRATRIGTRIGY